METSTSDEDPRTLTQDLIPVLQKFDSNSQVVNNIYVTKNQFKIGRARDNDEVICSMVISRHHCMLECDSSESWTIRNFSLNGTVLNGHVLGQNEARSISLGDVVQFSAIEDYKYYFTLRFKEEIPVKRQRTEPQNDSISRETTFRNYQEAKRREIQNEILLKKTEQRDLKNLLGDYLKRQETERDDYTIAERITCIKTAIDSAERTQKVLEETYNCYLSEMEEERRQFDAKVKHECKKLQKKLNVSGKQVEKIIGEKMELWTREHKNKWSEIMKSVMREERLRQDRLESENLSLAEKLRRAEEALRATEDALREKSALAEQLQQQQCQDVKNDDELTDSMLTSEASIKNNLRDKVENIIDEQLSCSICSEIFVNPTSLNCSHTFCEYCINSWRRKTKHAKCPICRKKIKSMNQSRVFDCLIEKMVSELSSELRERRQQLIDERKTS